MKKHRKIWLFSMAVILTAIASSATIAYLIAETPTVNNKFVPAVVACEVQEEFNGTVKKDVAIKNTGEVQSYIRTKVVITFMSADETMVTATVPQENTDYTITYANNPNWQLGTDGFWYYKVPVNVGDSTETLIESCALMEGASVPDGFYLSVEVVASAIQSTPAWAVTDKWSVGMQNGTLVIE